MQIKYVSCDGSTVTELIIRAKFMKAYSIFHSRWERVLECTRPGGDIFEVEVRNVKHIKADREFRRKEREILQAIVKMCNADKQVTFAADWGGNSLTIIRGNGIHTHCGSLEGTYEQLINDLHGALVEGRGLSWEKGQK